MGGKPSNKDYFKEYNSDPARRTTTNVIITKDDKARLKDLAQTEKTTLLNLIKEAINLLLYKRSTSSKKSLGG